MDTKFSVFEVLKIAEKVENRAANFYVRAAGLFEDTAIKDLYYRFAEWKAQQQKAWARMRQEFSERTGEFGTYDPDNFVQSNPQVMAGLTWMGEGHKSRHLTGKESKLDVLKDCIHRENAVITFYQGLKDFARDQGTCDTVDKLMAQENKYIMALMEEMNKS